MGNCILRLNAPRIDLGGLWDLVPENFWKSILEGLWSILGGIWGNLVYGIRMEMKEGVCSGLSSSPLTSVPRFPKEIPFPPVPLCHGFPGCQRISVKCETYYREHYYRNEYPKFWGRFWLSVCWRKRFTASLYIIIKQIENRSRSEPSKNLPSKSGLLLYYNIL